MTVESDLGTFDEKAKCFAQEDYELLLKSPTCGTHEIGFHLLSLSDKYNFSNPTKKFYHTPNNL